MACPYNFDALASRPSRFSRPPIGSTVIGDILNRAAIKAGRPAFAGRLFLLW